MSLFKRGADILRANLNDLLDKAEDPEKQLNLYLADARDGLTQSRTAVHDAITTERELQAQWDLDAADVTKWQRRAELEAGQPTPDAAAITEAVEQKRKAQSRLDNAKDPLAKAKADTVAFKAQVEGLEQRIEDADRNKGALIARARMAKARQATADALAHVQATDPTSGFASMESKVRHLEAAAEASEELTHTHRSDLEDHFRQLESGHEGGSVDNEVAALLAKHGKAPAAEPQATV